jgi:carboxymethylenebutenolidase
MIQRLKLLLSALALLTTTAAWAATPQTISYPSGDQTVQGLLYLPTGTGPHPAIVVIHEWWGLNDWIKQQASDYADQGYVALAVDLYRGKVASDPEMAHELMRGLPQDRGVRDLVSAVAYLKTRKDVNTSRIGAVGWCMGGGYTAQLALAEPSLRAAAINYGSLPTDPAALKQIHAKVLGNFGGLDQGIPPADVQAFAAAMKADGNPIDVKIYPDAGHAFENPNNKTGYRSADAADAKQRMNDFFTRTLRQ